ncbi:unnamed protein product [Rotaria sordida]|uniref:Uncharacterized protein n=1 Tax=Rotaria sordida TaxID=392033 RepID=A0A815H9E4_9BILA|nr:unnamed protein product [Rotaria sordida]CAF1602054.1 unnamed protein product [Rotaria sordida]
MIKLLLRRGANSSLSDWSLLVLALAVRAGDKDIVELLLKKKAQVNCRLNVVRHASLIPLHIACGCLSSNVIDIAQQLLEHEAHINAESLPSDQEYLSLADPSVIDIHRINGSVPHGRTPLHIVCTREATEDTLSLVRLLLEHHANPNALCNGRTSPSLAITLGNERLVDLLINHETTDPSTSLGLRNGKVLCTILSTVQESQWTYAKRLELVCKESIKRNLFNLYFICILN